MALSDSSPQSEFAREVFLKHYDKLSKLRLEILASNLVTEKVINADDHESIRAATNTSNQSAIILRAISSHLDVDYTESFFLLLDLMETLGDLVMQKVAGEINQQLNRPSRGAVNELSSDQPTEPSQKQEIDFSKHSVDNAFSILTANIYKIFKLHRIEFEVLRRACFENANTLFGASIPKELVDRIHSSDSLNKLFDVLAFYPSYWSWINIRILTKMVGVSGVAEAMELVERYKQAVFSRKLSMLLKQIPHIEISPDYYSLVEQKWERSLDEVTVQDLVTHWSNMEQLFNVKEPTLLLRKVVDGCVEIHWLIPTHLVDHVSSAVFNARHTVMSIISLKINGHVILCNDEETEEYSDTSSGVVAKGDELSQFSLAQYLTSSHSIRPSLVEQAFSSLVDHVITLLLQSSISHKQLLHQCKALMASDAHKIGLLSDIQLKELGDCRDNSSLLQDLNFLWTWSDHSVLEALASSCDDAVELLAQFDAYLNCSQLISAYPVPTVSPDMASRNDSLYTVLAIKCDQLLHQCTLRYIFDIRALLMKTCGITAHSLQLLAARTGPTVLYWTIPKCVVNVIIHTVSEYCNFLHGMISEVLIYPSTRIVMGSNRMLGSLFHLSPAMSPTMSADTTVTSAPEASERAELINKCLSQPEVLSAIVDNLISDIRNKSENIFQLRLDYHRMSKMYQHVIQQRGQLQVDMKTLEGDVAKYKELYEKKTEDFVELERKNEEEMKEAKQLPVTHSAHRVKLEESMKTLQAALEELRTSCQEISSYSVHTETGGKAVVEEQWKSGEVTGDLTSAKLITISEEIMEAKDWTDKLKIQNLELQRALNEKSKEAEERNVKVKQLEAEADNVQVEELRKQLLKKVADLRSNEESMKTLQAALKEFRTSCQEISSYGVHTETGGKAVVEEQWKSSEVTGDLTSAKLITIREEIMEAKDWVDKLKIQNLELQRALNEKSKEAEERNVKVKQLEAEADNVQVEELKKEKKQLLKKVADLRSDVKKPEKIHFGTGRYGETYKMNYEGTWCTAKVLHKILLNSSKFNEDVVTKVKKHCSILHHANLVTFIGVTEVDKQPAIMTELMEVNLFTYIEQNTELTLDTQVSLCKDMSRGLEELHKHLLLHNNLHSRNVLIQDNRAKLADYYYPLLQVEGHSPDFTEILPFVAPEVIEDPLKCSQSSDVFSLAVLCLKVVTGKTAVQEHKQNLAAVSQSHILLPLIHKCLSDKIDRRPSAIQICDEIKAIQDSPQYISFKALKQTNSVPLFQAVKAGNKQLEWRTCATLPAPVVGASAVVLENIIYVSGGESPDEFAGRYVFAYHLLENCWERLPPLTHSYGVPVVISNKLVIIGGKDFKNRKFTNQVSTYNRSEQKWESVYPNLGKERYGPLAIAYEHHVIVGGGKFHTIYDRLYDDIEILDIQDVDSLIWKRVPTRLPAKMWSPSATISNEQLWIVGYNNDNSGSFNLIEQRSDEVFRIPVADVIASDKKGKWDPLPRVMPYYSSTVVPNSVPIVTVGGDTKDTRTVKALEMHHDSSNTWEQVASLEGPSRAYVTVACIGEQQAVVVLGGCTQTKNKKARHDSSLALVQIGYGV